MQKYDKNEQQNSKIQIPELRRNIETEKSKKKLVEKMKMPSRLSAVLKSLKKYG